MNVLKQKICIPFLLKLFSKYNINYHSSTILNEFRGDWGLRASSGDSGALISKLLSYFSDVVEFLGYLIFLVLCNRSF